MTALQRTILDFQISIAEQSKHKTWLCVNGEYLTLDEAKQLREEYDANQGLCSEDGRAQGTPVEQTG